MRTFTWAAGLLLLFACPPHASAAPLPIAIGQNLGLAFGRFTPGSGSGTVAVTALGARSYGGGVTLIGNSAYSAAWFTVTGEPNTAYAIVLPGPASLSSGGNSMSVGSFETSPDGSGLLGGSGSQALYVGGILTIGAHQPSGNYNGSFAITVAYN